MDITYAMPGQTHRLFINVIHACPNACFFCVDFKGTMFYGFDLKNGKWPSVQEIISSIVAFPLSRSIREVYFCGIGEPLLRYDTVVEAAAKIRTLLPPQTIIAINTSGTFYLRDRRVDFARQFDLIQISLNAESEEKYNLICRPKVQGTYKAMMAFLYDLRKFLDRTGSPCRVELSVVDPSEIDSLPEREWLLPAIPMPDIEACQRIAESLGWPLKVKRLIKNCDREEWRHFAANLRRRTPHTSARTTYEELPMIDWCK